MARVASVAIYAVFLVVAPFEHHDLICHIKTPQHCTSCASSLLGSDPHTPAVVGTWHLRYAGRTHVAPLLRESALLAVRTTGRSPPASV